MEFYEQQFAFPVIEGFHTLRLLDEGADSTVWVIEDDSTHEEFALKILPPGTSRDAAAEESMGLEHEFLVKGLGMVSSSSGPGILMEYCPAGSVAQVVAVRGPLGVGETITVIAPIASALSYLHGQGFTHGDLSPRNILFTAEGKPKLADFGTHRAVGQSPGEFGTNGFCAPETALEGAPGVLRPARDIYALAACTWYLLTGRPPNATASRIPLGSMVPEVNDEFAKLLEQSLSQDPDMRPTAEQFGHRIFVAGEPLPVELGEAVDHEALKHMLTTRQAPASGGFLGRRRREAPSVADKELLRERKAQIKAQQKPVPRKLRAVFKANGNAPVASAKAAHEAHWASQHRIHGLKQGNRRIAWTLGSGVLLVVVAAGGAAWTKENSEPAIGGTTHAQVTELATEPERIHGPGSESPGLTDHELFLAAAELASRRDTGLMEGKPDTLREVHAPGSPSLAVDEKVMATMKGLELHLEGLETRLQDVQAVSGGGPGRAALEADSEQGGYRYVDAKGKVVVSVREAESQRVRMLLQFGEGRWRLWEVTAVK